MRTLLALILVVLCLPVLAQESRVSGGGAASSANLWVDAAGGMGVRGQQTKPYSSLTNAIKAALPGDIINLVGPNSVSTLVGLTNVTVNGNNGYLLTSFTNGPCAVLLVGTVYLNDLTISNTVDGNAGFSLVACAGSGLAVYGRHVNLYGSDRAALLGDTAAGSISTMVFQDSLFQAKSTAMETWGTKGHFINCSLNAIGPFAADNFTQAYVANDRSTNQFDGCSLLAIGGVSQNIGILLFAYGNNLFNGGSIQSYNVAAGDSLIYNAEGTNSFGGTPTVATFNGTFLNPTYTNGPRCLIATLLDSVLLSFNSCVYPFETNGVVVVNDGEPNIIVTGGNLRSSNFSDLSQVSFSNGGSAAVQTNWISGTRYTNTSSSDWFVRAAAKLTTAAVTGDAGLELQTAAQGSTLAFLSGTEMQTTVAVTIAMVYTNDITGFIPAGNVFTFTNVSSGSGNVGSLITGTGQKKQF